MFGEIECRVTTRKHNNAVSLKECLNAKIDSTDPRAVEAMELVDRLERDHEEADEHHAMIDMLARQWLAADRLAVDHSAELRHRLARLRALYTRHIAAEDRELFPTAAR